MADKAAIRFPLRTAIIGFGMIGAGNDDDPVMGKTYRYPSHASAIAAHPGFSLDATVDWSAEARGRARDKWGIRNTFASVADLNANVPLDVAVLCMPPAGRHEVLAALPQLRGLIVEKPIGKKIGEAEAVAALCREKAPAVQVNYWRRADATFRKLAEGKLGELIGEVQGGLAIYGNGLHNNGSHLVDFVRMLVDEITSVQAFAGVPGRLAGPLADDEQFAFSMVLESGAVIHAMPLDFAHYRENGLDLWGTKGRLSILQDSRTILYHERRAHRGLSDAFEIASDVPRDIPPTFGNALYGLYDNLHAAIHHGKALCSSLDEALESERVVEAAVRSRANGGVMTETRPSA